MRGLFFLIGLLASPALAQVPTVGAGSASRQTTSVAVSQAGQSDENGWHRDFAAAIRKCWLVESETAADRITVGIVFGMSPDGTAIANSLQMVRASDGSVAAVKTAYEAARRAILRCGASGFDLPTRLYDEWKQVEITFDPAMSGMK